MDTMYQENNQLFEIKKNPNRYIEKDAITEKITIPSKYFKDPLNPQPEVNLRRERERGPENCLTE